MKVVLAGACGHLGMEIYKSLLKAGHEVTAADLIESDPETEGKHTFVKLDVTKPESLQGLCDGADLVISTVGLTTASKHLTNMQIDYQGNLNLLREAQRAGVKGFIYISVLKADQAPKVPMLESKHQMEEALKASRMPYLIYRPTGYFYDIVKVFRPMIEKGSVTLLGSDPVSANVIDTPDFADYIVAHLGDRGKTVSIGGRETYTYEEIARMCFAAAGKPAVIKHAPAWLFDVLAWFSHVSGNGREAVIRFSKFTLSQQMVGDVKAGEHSFAAYIRESFAAPEAH